LGVQGKLVEAAAAYREALDLGGPEWHRFTRAAESMMLAYELTGDTAGGIKAAMDYAPELPRGQSFVNVMRVGIKCAASEKKTTLNGRAQYSAGSEHLQRLKLLAEEALNVPGGFGDDKAEIYQTLISVSRSMNNEAEAKKYATRMWEFLEQEAKTAPGAEARASLDSWRIAAAGFLNDPARAIPALEASERDLPGDYNPPMRLASIYARLNRFDDALDAYRRAYAKAYGVRKISILTSSASVYEKKGDKASAKRTLGQALKMAEALPEKQGGADYVKWIKTQLEKYN
jgi:tetratricopeptide (TPR) repeat protein